MTEPTPPVPSPVARPVVQKGRPVVRRPDVDTLFTGLRRTLPLLQHRADPLALTTDVVNWGDRVRKRWAYDYDWPEQKAAA